MDQTKQWWQSKAIWGNIISIAALAFGLTGHNISVGDQQILVDVISTVVTAAGQVYAIYGRIVATSSIGTSK